MVELAGGSAVVQVGDLPGPRCAHTFSMVSSTHGVLIGGATRLERGGRRGSGGGKRGESPSGGGAAGTSGSSGPRLDGFSADVYQLDLLGMRWRKLTPVGDVPSARAAHVVVCAGHMAVLHGGVGPQGLAGDNLFLLDLRDVDRPRWHSVLINKEPGSGSPGGGRGRAGAGTPGPRYGHCMVLVGKRILLLGGNDGQRVLSDVWALDAKSTGPHQWENVTPKTDRKGAGPAPRMYHAACVRDDGLVIMCGGRGERGNALTDAWALRQVNDSGSEFDWVQMPDFETAGKGRYGHSIASVGGRCRLIGGYNGIGSTACHSSIEFDFVTSLKWTPVEDPADPNNEVPRYRHGCTSVDGRLLVYGGLRGGEVLEDLQVVEINAPGGGPAADMDKDMDVQAPAQALDQAHGTNVPGGAPRASFSAPAEPALGTGGSSLMCEDEDSGMIRGIGAPRPHESNGSPGTPQGAAPASPGSPFVQTPPPTVPRTPAHVHLARRAIIAGGDEGPMDPGSGSLRPLGPLVRQVSVTMLENEARRINPFGASPGQQSADGSSPGGMPTGASKAIMRKVLEELMDPRGWAPPQDRVFFLDYASIDTMCTEVEALMQKEPNVLKLRAPVKVFGDIHGQFGDLMRLFDQYGAPTKAGDIDLVDYLFLGDYVDRGSHSLETMCLLLALKLEYPKQFWMIRGNHESGSVNSWMGFRDECVERMGEEQGYLTWYRINTLFNWMPIAATIEDKILCVHGGLGRSLRKVQEIEDGVQRPCTVEDGGQLLMDLLWSDPTENDDIKGLCENPRGPGLIAFGPDLVHDFCDGNDLDLIIRAHECVMDGFERFAGGRLITLFSATNYCGVAGNAGAILLIDKNLEVIPKLIQPRPVADVDADGVDAGVGEEGLDGDEDMDKEMDDTNWRRDTNQLRPPTPPRGRNRPPGAPLGSADPAPLRPVTRSQSPYHQDDPADGGRML